MTSEAHIAHLARPRLRVLSLIVEDHPGVLERVSSQIRRRGFNIASLSVGPTIEGRSRMTVTVDAGHAEIDQVAKQVDKLIEVIDVQDITEDPILARELALARVRVSGPARERLVAAVDRYGGRVVDAGPQSVVFELASDPSRIDGFLELLEPHGLEELARSGPVAMRRNPTQ